jgi:hypothetical protein
MDVSVQVRVLLVYVLMARVLLVWARMPHWP